MSRLRDMAMPSRADFELYIRQITEQSDRNAEAADRAVEATRSASRYIRAQILVAAVQIAAIIALVVTR